MAEEQDALLWRAKVARARADARRPVGDPMRRLEFHTAELERLLNDPSAEQHSISHHRNMAALLAAGMRLRETMTMLGIDEVDEAAWQGFVDDHPELAS